MPIYVAKGIGLLSVVLSCDDRIAVVRILISKHICKFCKYVFILLDKILILTIISNWRINIMRIFDTIKHKYDSAISLIEQRIEEKRLEQIAQIEHEKARVQGIANSEIPWDYVVKLECEYADENEDVCYIEKYVICKVPRDEIWFQKEIAGVVITGADFGRDITLSVGEDFYGKRQVSFWDNFDYMWHGCAETPNLSNQSFKYVRELNEYVNAYNKSRIDGMSQHDNSVMITKQ